MTESCSINTKAEEVVLARDAEGVEGAIARGKQAIDAFEIEFRPKVVPHPQSPNTIIELLSAKTINKEKLEARCEAVTNSPTGQ